MKRDRSRKLTVIGYKRYANKTAPVSSGYKRRFYQCSVCKMKTFLDSEDLAHSTPVITTPCGHGFQEDFKLI